MMKKAHWILISVVSVFIGSAVLNAYSATPVAQPIPVRCRSEVVLSPSGLAKSTQAGLKYWLATDPTWIQRTVNGAFDKMPATRRGPIKISKAALLQGTSGELTTYLSMSHMHLSDLRTSPPEITCEGNRCKVKVKVESLKFISDVQFFCEDSAGCKPNPPIDIRQISLQYDMKEHPNMETPSLEYDVEFHPADHLKDFFKVVPDSGKINLPLDLVTQSHVGLEMTDADRLKADQIEERQAELYSNRDRILAACPDDRSRIPSDQAIVLAQSWEEARTIAFREKYQDYLKNPMSASYFAFFKDLSESRRARGDRPLSSDQKAAADQLSQLYDEFLEKKLAPILAGDLNSGLQAASFFNSNIGFSLPVQTIKNTIDQAKYGDTVGNLKDIDSGTPSKKKKKNSSSLPTPASLRQFGMQIAGTGVDEDSNVVVDLSACPEAEDRKTERAAGAVDPITARKPGLNPPPGFDVAFSVDLPTLNSYLKDAFSNPDENKIHTRPLSEQSFLRKIDVDPEIKVMFKEPPQFYTKVIEVPVLDENGNRVKDPATGKYKVKKTLRPVMKFVLYEHSYTTLLTKYVHIFDKRLTGEASLKLHDTSSGQKVVNIEVDPDEFSRQPQWQRFDRALGGVMDKIFFGIIKDPIYQREYPKALKDKLNVNPEDLIGFKPLQFEASPDGTAINGAGQLEDLYDVIVREGGKPETHIKNTQ